MRTFSVRYSLRVSRLLQVDAPKHRKLSNCNTVSCVTFVLKSPSPSELSCVCVLFQGTHQIPLAVVFNPLHADSVMMLCGVH
jgi:hypothetical protein